MLSGILRLTAVCVMQEEAGKADNRLTNKVLNESNSGGVKDKEVELNAFLLDEKLSGLCDWILRVRKNSLEAGSWLEQMDGQSRRVI